MAVSSEQIVDFLVSNPGMSDAQIVSAMETYGISPAQMAQAVGLDEDYIDKPEVIWSLEEFEKDNF